MNSFNGTPNPTKSRQRLMGMTGIGLSVMTMGMFATAPTMADWPDVVAQMPDDAQIVLFTKSVADVNASYDSFMQAIDMANMAFVPGPVDGLQMMGVNTEAMDLSRSIGLAVLKDRWEADIPPILMFVPTSNYEQWTGALGAEPVDGTELLSFTPAGMGGGSETWYLRLADNDYAVMGLDQTLVTGYKAGNGAENKWSTLIGPLGADIAARSEIVAAIDFEGLAPIIKEGMNEGMKEMDANMPPGAALGAGLDPEQMMQMMEAYRELAELAIDDMQAACLGLRMGDNGAAFDLALQFKAESQMASYFPGSENPQNHLLRFSSDPYLMAMSMDTSGFNLADWAEMFMDKMPEGMMGMNNPMQMPGADKMMSEVKGMAMVMYPSPAGLMGGFLNSAVAMYVGDPDAIREGLNESFTSMNGQEMQGLKYTTEFAAGAQEVAGVSVDTYSMNIEFPPDMMMQGQQMMQMMYGPMGMRGFIAPVDNGVVLTMSRNSALLERTLNAANGQNGLGADPMLQSINEMLSPNPSGVVYLGIGTMLEQVAPMAAMFMPGLQIDADMLAKMPPLAMSMSADEGGVQGSLAVPAPLIRSGMELARQIQEAQMMNDGDMGGGEDEPDIF